jgi:hypothetical protein
MSLLSSKRIARGLAALLLLAAVVAMPALATAGTVTFSAPTISLTQSAGVQTGFLDVTISDSGSDVVNGFSVQLTTPGPITFTSGDTSTTPTYVFAGNSSDDTNGNPPFSVSGNLDYFNSDAANGSGQTVTSAPLGLLRIGYSIPANFVGTVTLSIPTLEQDPTFGAGYLDSGFNNIEPAIVNGSITVSAPATPEPSSIVLLMLGAIGLFGVRRLRRA